MSFDWERFFQVIAWACFILFVVCAVFAFYGFMVYTGSAEQALAVKIIGVSTLGAIITGAILYGFDWFG